MENKDQILKVKFDKVFEPSESQTEIFEYLKTIADDIIDGVSSGILAYGQTGSGTKVLTRKDIHHVWKKPVSEAN